MRNGSQLERLWRLQTKINMLVSDRKRDPGLVADVYQSILDGDARRWQERDGVIYFSVTSDYASGKDWIARLQQKDIRIDRAVGLLSCSAFKPTGFAANVAVLDLYTLQARRANHRIDNPRRGRQAQAVQAERRTGLPHPSGVSRTRRSKLHGSGKDRHNARPYFRCRWRPAPAGSKRRQAEHRRWRSRP